MSKMPTETLAPPVPPRTTIRRYALNGPTMGTRYAAVFYDTERPDIDRIGLALQAAVDLVDRQMSTWKPQSDLMRFNAAPVGEWVPLPAELLTVIEAGLNIGRQSGGAFDIATGDLVGAWGFATHGGTPDARAVNHLAAAPRTPAYERLDRDLAGGRLRKRAPVQLDLSGIAKGYGVDCLAETLTDFGVVNYLVSIDGEVRAHGTKPSGELWQIGVEQPLRGRRDIAGYVALDDGALATSGTYRHVVELGGVSYSHSMDPRSGRPVLNEVAAVTVRAGTCMVADAWATALLVIGPDEGQALARRNGVEVMYQLT